VVDQTPETDDAPRPKPAKTAPAKPVAAEQPPSLGLAEWCRRASQDGCGVEMLAGFYTHATSDGLVHAAPADFRAAYEAFGRRPA